MSAVSIFAKMGVVNSGDIQVGKNSLYEITKINDDKVESVINFYHIQRHLDPVINACREFLGRETDKQLEYIENLATLISNGGMPVLILLNGKDSGHAVVGYGVEHGVYRIEFENEDQESNDYEDVIDGNIITDTAKYYDSRVLIYDCNIPEGSEKAHLYYNMGTDEWIIPNAPEYNELILAVADVKLLDILNYQVETSNSTARIHTQGALSFYLYYKDRYEKITSETNLKEEGIFSLLDCNAVLDEDGDIIPADSMTVILPSLTESYTLKPISEDDNCNFDMMYENIGLSAISDKAESITFTPERKVSVEGNEGKYELTVCANEGYYNLPWYLLTVSGEDSEAIALEQTDDEILVSGTNLKGVKVTAENREETKNIEFSTDETKVLLSSENDGNTEMLVAKIDEDEDGTFETVLGDENKPNGGVTSNTPIAKPSENVSIELEQTVTSKDSVNTENPVTQTEKQSTGAPTGDDSLLEINILLLLCGFAIFGMLTRHKDRKL